MTMALTEALAIRRNAGRTIIIRQTPPENLAA